MVVVARPHSGVQIPIVKNLIQQNASGGHAVAVLVLLMESLKAYQNYQMLRS